MTDLRANPYYCPRCNARTDYPSSHCPPVKDCTSVALSIHPASAGGQNPNRGKKRGQRLPQAERVAAPKYGSPRTGSSRVTVILLDPATLRASRARTTTGNISERVIESGMMTSRIKSNRGLRAAGK